MGRIIEVPWTIQETKERVTVGLDEEGYKLFLKLRDAVFQDGRFIVEGEERERAVREIDALMCLYHYFPGARMLDPVEQAEHEGAMPPEAVTDALKIMEGLAEKDPRWALPEGVKAMMAEGQTTLLEPPATSPRLPYHEADDTEREDSEPPAWATPSPVTASDSVASRLPDFDGETYCAALDHERLGKQLLRVGRQMADGEWHTLAELAAATGDPEASISARLRDLRKRKFGGHTVNRERAGGGLFRYRLIREQFATPWEDEEAEVVLA